MRFRSEARDAAVLADGFGAHAWQACAPVSGMVVRAWLPMTSGVGQGQLLAGRYRLQEPVAAGGAGRVWRAMDLVLERMVAVKLLLPEVAGDPLAAARFLAEARSASRLSHPGIAQVHDYGDAGPADVPFLVMELIDGPSLAEVLLAGPLDPDRTMDVLAQVPTGLHAAHSAGVVHRDIKPANLLTGRDGQVKITDFGIASVIGSAPVTFTDTSSARLPTSRPSARPAHPPLLRPTCIRWAWSPTSALRERGRSPGPRPRSAPRICSCRSRRYLPACRPGSPCSWPTSLPGTRRADRVQRAKWRSGPLLCIPVQPVARRYGGCGVTGPRLNRPRPSQSPCPTPRP
jgi:serine/threonine protein kinase